MLAGCHKLHIPEAVRPLIPGHKMNLILLKIKTKDLFILFAPAHTVLVRKKDKDWILHPFLYIVDSSLEVTVPIALTIHK